MQEEPGEENERIARDAQREGGKGGRKEREEEWMSGSGGVAAYTKH